MLSTRPGGRTTPAPAPARPHWRGPVQPDQEILPGQRAHAPRAQPDHVQLVRQIGDRGPSRRCRSGSDPARRPHLPPLPCANQYPDHQMGARSTISPYKPNCPRSQRHPSRPTARVTHLLADSGFRPVTAIRARSTTSRSRPSSPRSPPTRPSSTKSATPSSPKSRQAEHHPDKHERHRRTSTGGVISRPHVLTVNAAIVLILNVGQQPDRLDELMVMSRGAAGVTTVSRHAISAMRPAK